MWKINIRFDHRDETYKAESKSCSLENSIHFYSCSESVRSLINENMREARMQSMASRLNYNVDNQRN